MTKVKNILFIMYDQLRFDYLSCAGHPHLKTPNFDKVAAKGVRFTNAYVQSPVCGASRMSFYTGRYVSSHGAANNGFPIRVGEQTLGDHLRANDMDCYIIGKTHMKADADGMARLGLTEESIIGARQAQCGFDNWTRDDGLWGQGPDGFYDEKRSPYNEYLKGKGYAGDNPWAHFANAGVDDDGNQATGWIFANADKAANIKEEDSETPWLTREAMRFVDEKRDSEKPWCAHLSYIKPHWPYIVPAPYHNMFGANHVPAANRHASELENPHPIYGAWLGNKISAAFQRNEVRGKVIPAYMGLIKQCDDQLGVLLDHLDETGEAENTIIVLTSDHGDYLGDHWLGEKDLFHEPSVKIPLIMYDPSTEANSTRGTEYAALIEAIDLTATLIDYSGGEVPRHIVEGRSLRPWLEGAGPDDWRSYVISEYDYSMRGEAQQLGLSPKDARLFMIFDGRYKMIHGEGGFRPMLFDHQEDPSEFHDQGANPAFAEIIAKLYKQLHQWSLRQSQRVTRSDVDIQSTRTETDRRGILPFLADGSEVPAELLEKYTGKAIKNYLTETEKD